MLGIAEFATVAAIYVLAGLVRGFAGFGFAIVAVPVLSLVYSPGYAVAVNAVVGICLTAYTLGLHKREVDWRRVYPLVLVSLSFVAPGALLVYTIPEALAMQALGISVVGLTGLTMVSRGRIRRSLGSPVAGVVFSAVGGFLTGAFTTGGPPIVAYLYNSDDSRLRAKANTQLFFAALGIAVLIIHSSSGALTLERAISSVPYVPAALIGGRIGVVVSRKTSPQVLAVLTDACLVALGCYIFVSYW